MHPRSARPDGVQDSSDIGRQIGRIARLAVRKSALGEGPDPFVWIQLRRVRGKVLDLKTGVTLLKHVQRHTLVRVGVVQQGDHGAPQVALQVAKECADLDLADVPQRVQPVVQTEPLSSWADRHT
jgi:hypothetical protein